MNNKSKKKDNLEKYQDLKYFIEKKITVENTISVKENYCQGMFLYVIKNPETHFRFLMFSPYHYEVNSIKIGKELDFIKVGEKNENFFLTNKNTFLNHKYYKFSKEKGDLSCNIQVFGMKKANDFYVNNNKIHTKRIAIENPLWAIEEVKTLNYKSLKKKFKKEYLADTKFDKMLENLFILTLFDFPDRTFQMYNSHSIILTQGKTGKSSLLCSNSTKADEISIAGLYGSSDSVRGIFKSGLVDRTKDTIIIDEINELAEKNNGKKIIEIFNTPLENGIYNYQKNNPKEVEISNQFFLLGNIDEVFNFETFIDAIFSNPLTIGRRFAIVLYNDNLKYIKGRKHRKDKQQNYTILIKNYLSSILVYYIYIKKIHLKIMNKKYYIDIENDYKKEIDKIIKNIQMRNSLAFIKNQKDAMQRMLIASLKLAIFDSSVEIFNCKDITKFRKSKLVQKSIEYLKEIIENNLKSYENISEHLQHYNISDKTQKYNTQNFKKLSKIKQQLVKIFYVNSKLINGMGVKKASLKHLGDTKYFFYNLKNGRTSLLKFNEFFRDYGINITKQSNDIFFRFTNKKLFENSTYGVFEKQKEENKNDDEIDMSDLN